MADAWAVKFANGTLTSDILLTATEGVYDFTPAVRGRLVSVESLPGCGRIAKVGGQAPASMTLTLTWLTTVTTAATVWAFYTRCLAIWNGVPGTLTVPDIPAMANVIVTGVSFGAQEAIQQPTALNAASTAIAAGYAVKATVTLEWL